MDISMMGLTPLDDPADYIENVEAGILTLRGGKRFRMELFEADVSQFTPKEWEFVATSMVTMLVKKQLLSQDKFAGAYFSRKGIKDYQTNRFFRHKEREDTRRDWEELHNFLQLQSAKTAEEFVRAKVQQHKNISRTELILEVKDKFKISDPQPLIQRVTKGEKRFHKRLGRFFMGALDALLDTYEDVTSLNLV